MILRRYQDWSQDPLLNFFSPAGFSSVRRLQEEMNRLFDGVAGDADAGYPAVNVWTNGEGATVIAELPGISPEEVDLSVVSNTLEIKGERKASLPPGEGSPKCLRRERGEGAFSRSIELPFLIKSEAVSAEYKNGLLTVTLPRAEEDKPKKITIR